MRSLLSTNDDWALTFVRVALGAVFLPHGLQKTIGWFGGPGYGPTMSMFEAYMHIPALLAFLAIMAELLGGIGLILGLLTRVAAFGIAVNMVVAIIVLNHQFGPFMNWTGKQAGEGYEFHVLCIAMALALMLKGGGAASVDGALTRGAERPLASGSAARTA